jgi:CheY-like chemotaxis protein
MVWAGLSWGQAAKGKKSGAAGKAAATKDAAEDKADKGSDEKSADTKKKPAKEIDLPTVELPDPAVEAVLATKPSTPSELVRAGKALADLRRPDLARERFQRALAAGLDPKALAALADEFGPAMFSAIALRKELAPEGKQLADAVLGAKIQQLQDPKRMAGLIQELGDPSPEARALAIAGLQDAGAAAVGPLLAVLGDAQRTAEHAAARAALTAIGTSAHGPLVAAIDSPDPKLAVEAIHVLADVRAIRPSFFLLRACCEEKGNPEVRAAAQAAAKRIWRHVPGLQEAAQMLADLSQRYAKRLEPLEEDPYGQVVVWFWDDAKKQVSAKVFRPEDAARWFAARFARDAHAILPERKEMLLLHLATMLEQAAHEAGLDKPLAADKDSPAGRLAAMGADAAEDVLTFAVQNGHAAAATAAARILAPLPGTERLLHRAAQPCPLVLATRHPDRRLRLAALQTVMRLQPRDPYPGASYVCEALGFMAASRGATRVLVASPRRDESMRLAEYFVKLGYETDHATTGRELVRKALQSPDYELVLVDAIVSYPTVDEVLQSLRRDGRTALVPVGVLASAGDLERAKHIVRNDPRAEAFPRPHDFATVQSQVEDLLARSGDVLTAVERKRQAGLALDWLAELSRPQGGLYDLYRVEETVLAALAVPGLSAKACVVLGNLGTPAAQQALIDVAARKETPLSGRKAALEGFRTGVQRRGILLTTAKIQSLYDRYNRSAGEAPASQAVLGLILDCIEAPTKPLEQTSRRAKGDVPQMARGGDKPDS